MKSSYSEILESNVLMEFREQISQIEDKDTINKLYRQVRVWVRFHCHYAHGCTEEESQELNRKIKNIRWKRLCDLGYEIPKWADVDSDK